MTAWRKCETMTRNKKQTYVATVFLLLFLYFVLAGLQKDGILSNMLGADRGIIRSHWSSVINFICINIILATSLNITVGCLGQINLGHAGFMSVGAYAGALFLKAVPWEGAAAYFPALLIGGLCAGVVGFLIGIPALRLKGDYLAIITLGFGEIIRVLIQYFDFTGGAQGLQGIPKMQNFTLIFFLMCASVALMFSIMTSRHGRVVLAIREDEIAAAAAGVDTTRTKTFAFTLSAVFAGIAGTMYAANIGAITAAYFDYNQSINLLVMVVLGGMGSFTGSTLSAIVLTLLPELLRSFNEYRMILYALILVLLMIFRPMGLLGREEFQLSKVIARLFPSKTREAAKNRATTPDHRRQTKGAGDE